MRRELYFNTKQSIKDDIRNIEGWEPKIFKEDYDNEISKIYDIDTHGKFTIIVHCVEYM